MAPSKDTLSDDQQGLRRSTRSTRGQPNQFLQANYLLGDEASRPAPAAPKRRRPASSPSPAASLPENENGKASSPSAAAATRPKPKRRRLANSPGDMASEKGEASSSSAPAVPKRNSIIFDTIHVVTSAPSQSNVLAAAPRLGSPQLFQQPSGAKQGQQQSYVPPQNAFGPAGGQPPARDANGHQIDPCAANAMIMDLDPLFGDQGAALNQQQADPLEAMQQSGEFDQLYDGLQMWFNMGDPDAQVIDAMSQYRQNMDRLAEEDRLAAQEEPIDNEQLDEMWDQFVNHNPSLN
ncbi:hypothetical protein FSARC_8658 [Fusarium sarcochroum]|uniref:Uncharacterized protein n=1 Tax=Fusarium sarcochroum TaxID=1208366 RepID=A0A8H4TST8_9HYPO|nr:hypothetical protein FSARC_8658 [Fusarium sarcochroum]